MGVYIDLDLVAWSDDGSSALVTRTTSSSAGGGVGHDYILVTSGDKHPVVAAISDTQDPDHATEHVDRAACAKAALSLAKAVAAKHFRGVTIHADRCAAKRDVVAVNAEAARVAATSWIAKPVQRAATDRETAGWAIAKKVTVDPSDVSAASAKLFLVFTGYNGDSSGPAHVAVFDADQSVLIDDLRGVK
jgi:hypothetical protein